MNEQNIDVFIGRVFDLCVEKGHELPIGHEDRKFKGRVVFGRNDVWTQNRDIAVFQELASQPATLEASCAADAYGCIEGHTIEQADAEQAHAQALRNWHLRTSGDPDTNGTGGGQRVCCHVPEFKLLRGHWGKEEKK